MTEKTKKQLFVLLILAAVLAASWLYMHRGQKGAAAPAFNIQKTQISRIGVGGQAAGMAKKAGVKPVQRNPINYTGRQNRDPLDDFGLMAEKEVQEEPAAVKQAAPFPKERFSVSATIWGTGNPQAIINDKIMNVGEKLDDAKIVNIDKQGVHLEYEGAEVLLEVK